MKTGGRYRAEDRAAHGMYRRDMTMADLAELVGWHQAAPIIDPRCSSKLMRLAKALGALGQRITISVEAEAAVECGRLTPGVRGGPLP